MKQSKHLTLVGVTLVVASLIAVLPSEAKTDLTKKMLLVFSFLMRSRTARLRIRRKMVWMVKSRARSR